MSLSVGQEAPDFTLKNSEGEVVSLSDFRGKKVVLVFFPFAFTGICTAELCAIRDNADNFIDDETVVVSISCDSSPTLKNFKEQENFSHILLSDFWPHGEVARAYGVFLEERGMATRGTFVIDREGVIQWLVINEPGSARNTADYRDALAKIG
ncbi:MAG: peroxiredoxin [Actinobacteria bacterium]|nr:peroxiredoxin [Actinomycetota bacterium]